jgi:uncharacterized protein YbcI
VSDLTNIEKVKLERLLGMSSGYVADFSNRTFHEFVLDSTGKDIYDSAYANGSGSKAQRLRAFWKVAPNHTVGRLLDDLLSYISDLRTPDDPQLLETCRKVAERLLQSAPVTELDALTPNAVERGFESLAKSLRESIDKNEPEAALDRLHTFVVKYIRVLCQQRGITTDRNKPLHSLVGEYVKSLKTNGEIESEMTERILKSSISIMEAFNTVRNEQSFAHDNPVLGYDESLLIFNHVASAIRFIEAIERRNSHQEAQAECVAVTSDEIPF